jgi:hypothetical protein
MKEKSTTDALCGTGKAKEINQDTGAVTAMLGFVLICVFALTIWRQNTIDLQTMH